MDMVKIGFGEHLLEFWVQCTHSRLSLALTMLRSVSYSRRLGRLHVRWLHGRYYVAINRTARTAGSIKVYSYEVIIVEDDFYFSC